MSRFVAVLDWSAGLDLAEALRRAREAMTRGGSREACFEIHAPPFAALVLSHQERAPFDDRDGAIAFQGGFGPGLERARGFLRQCREHLRRGAEPGEPPRLPEGPFGRRCLLEWRPEASELTLVTEPNAQLPVYLLDQPGLAIVASEPKAIWAIRRAALHPNADTLVDLCTFGMPLVDRTLFREIAWAEPGTIYGFGRGGGSRRSYGSPSFSERRGGDVGRLAEAMNRALVETLESYRPACPRVTVALSGGMDSRYVLAGARRVWRDLEGITFGQGRSDDVALARAIAERARIAHHRHPPPPAFLPSWAAYAVWRADGLLSCQHAHGADALIARSDRSPYFLNGIGGDLLLGAFLRPEHLLLRGEPTRAARDVARRRGFHRLEPSQILKPEVLAQATDAPLPALERLMGRWPRERLGNTLLCYWLRHHCARITAIGLTLEAPYVEHIGPMVDAAFVRAVEELPLELRFMGRAYRRALAGLAPELMDIPWERVGVSPRWPWPVLAAAKLGRRLGLLARPRPAVDYAAELRTTARPWLESILLAPAALEDGFLLPDYLRGIVGRHLDGGADHTAELCVALTIELWRRLFVEGEGDLFPAAVGPAPGADQPPVPARRRSSSR